MTTQGASAYLDVPGYLRATTNQETASLLGLNTLVAGSGATPAGATSVPVVASAGWVAGSLWLLDGPYSEVAQVTGAPDATHLTLAAPGLRFAHASGVSASQAGPAGSLAEALLRASGWMENYCRQGAASGDRSLYALSRSERWGAPSMRAYLDRDSVLVVRPSHFPVASVTALAVEFGQGQTTLTLDPTQIELASDGRLVEAPIFIGAAGAQSPLTQALGLSRTRHQWLTLTYTGGLPIGAVPYDAQQACVWVTSELLAQRRNPSGAAALRQGKFELQARTRDDKTGDSILLLQAKALLQLYREVIA